MHHWQRGRLASPVLSQKLLDFYRFLLSETGDI